MLAVTRSSKRDLVRSVITGVAIECAVWLLISVGAAQWCEDWWYVVTGYFWNDDRLPLGRWLYALQRPLETIYRYVALALFAHLKGTLPFPRSLTLSAYVGLACAVVFGVFMWTAATFIVLRLVKLLRTLNRSTVTMSTSQ